MHRFAVSRVGWLSATSIALGLVAWLPIERVSAQSGMPNLQQSPPSSVFAGEVNPPADPPLGLDVQPASSSSSEVASILSRLEALEQKGAKPADEKKK